MEVGSFFPVNDVAIKSAGAAEQPSEQRAAAAQQFEKIFASTLVHQMLDTGGGGLIAEGPGRSVLAGMLEERLADLWAESGALGLRGALTRWMTPVSTEPVEIRELPQERSA